MTGWSPAPRWTPAMTGRDWLRFFTMVTRTESCWIWTGPNSGAGGYGKFHIGKKHDPTVFAHRVVAAHAFGGIPEGLVVDHLCRNRACVNPGHLAVVTMRENTARGMSPGAISARTGLCRNGHSLEVHASRRKASGKVVYCRVCRNEKRRAETVAKRAAR